MRAALLVAVFDGWGFVPIVSGALAQLKFRLLYLIHKHGTTLPTLIMSKTAPDPLLQLEHESAFYWILMHELSFSARLFSA